VHSFCSICLSASLFRHQIWSDILGKKGHGKKKRIEAAKKHLRELEEKIKAWSKRGKMKS
jgi:hypothetical protein